MAEKKKKTNEWPRHRIQALWALLTNSYLIGFVQGKIYKGKLKNLCVPGLNCYSCPGAVGSCPICSLQAVIGSWNFKFAFYVAGFLVFVGALIGRFVCGACAKVCKMQIDPSKTPNHLECIRCGQCKKICPTGALSSGCLKKNSFEIGRSF